MGVLVEATRLGYYGNVRQRPGTQFVMADADYYAQKPELDIDGEPKKDKDGEVIMTEQNPSWVVFVDDNYDDPVPPVQKAQGKVAKKGVFKKDKKERQPDDHRQGGAFHVDTDSGIQVTGQVAPAKPVVPQGVSEPAFEESAPKESKKKSSGDKNVI